MGFEPHLVRPVVADLSFGVRLPSRRGCIRFLDKAANNCLQLVALISDVRRTLVMLTLRIYRTSALPMWFSDVSLLSS